MAQSITATLTGLDKLNALPAQIERAKEKALDAGGKVAQDHHTAEVSKTYRRPARYQYVDDRGRTIKRNWEPRSGDLQRGQAVRKLPGERQILTVGKAAEPIKNYPGGYAEKLQTLPTSKDGKNRANPYPKNAVKAAEPQIQRVVESEFRNNIP